MTAHCPNGSVSPLKLTSIQHTPTLLEKSDHVTLSRVCIHHSLTLLFNSQSSETLLFTIFRTLSQFGNVSKHFRSILLDVLLDFLSTPSFSLDVPRSKSCLAFLENFFPTCHFCLTWHAFSSNTPLLRPPCSVDFYLRSFHYLHQALFLSISDLAKVFTSYSMVNVYQFLLCSNVNSTMLNFLSSNLPSLRELTLVDINPTFGDFLSFPEDFSQLLSLCCIIRGASGSAIDVSQLVSLKSLEIQSSCVLVGTSLLENLQVLVLSSIILEDGLHVSTRLLSLKVDGLSQESLHILFKNSLNFKFCKVDLCVSDYSRSEVVEAGYRDYVLSYDPSEDEGPFVSAELPRLETLEFTVYDNHVFNLELSGSPYLASLQARCFGGELSLKISSAVLYLSELYLFCFDESILLKLLTTCPYIRTLTLCRLTQSDIVDLRSVPTFTLNHLEILDVSDCYCYKILPVLPRLKKCTLRDSSLDSNFVNVKCPKLENLYISNYRLTDYSSLNFSVRNLEVSITNGNCPSDRFNIALGHYKFLDRLTLSVASLNEPHIVKFPASVSVFKFEAPQKVLQVALNSMPKLVVVSGKLRGSVSSEFTQFLSDYKQLHRHVLVSVHQL
ncbi:hypothetical protein RCL1_002261 [Eukaryota sp. TZLM3-RCL]